MKKFVVATLVVPAVPRLDEFGAIARSPISPNIVFILIDDLRWDELEITGHPHEARTGTVVGQELT
jgi:hypothetical protein